MFSIVIISVDFRCQSCVVIQFFYSSGALLVQNVSLTTPLYLGKNYAHRKRTVKHISSLHFSGQKKRERLSQPKSQLAQTGPVLLELQEKALRVTSVFGHQASDSRPAVNRQPGLRRENSQSFLQIKIFEKTFVDENILFSNFFFCIFE